MSDARIRNIETTKHSINGISSHYLITISFNNGVQVSSKIKTNADPLDVMRSLDELYLEVQDESDLDNI